MTLPEILGALPRLPRAAPARDVMRRDVPMADGCGVIQMWSTSHLKASAMVLLAAAGGAGCSAWNGAPGSLVGMVVAGPWESVDHMSSVLSIGEPPTQSPPWS